MTAVTNDVTFEMLARRNDELITENQMLAAQLELLEARPEVLIQRLDLDTPSPARLTPGSAGWDLITTRTVTLFPGKRHAFPLGVAMAIPEGHAGQLWPRSGLAKHHGIDRLAGLIDADYRGEAKAILINHGDSPVELIAGERICQLVVVPIVTRMIEVESLPETQRGSAGFGSTHR